MLYFLRKYLINKLIVQLNTNRYIIILIYEYLLIIDIIYIIFNKI
jgi:hypothetical protein